MCTSSRALPADPSPACPPCSLQILDPPQPYKPYGEEPKDDYPNYYDDDGDYYKKGHKSHSKRHYEDKDDEPEYEEEYAKIEVR